jgi:hypothetical protein
MRRRYLTATLLVLILGTSVLALPAPPRPSSIAIGSTVSGAGRLGRPGRALLERVLEDLRAL